MNRPNITEGEWLIKEYHGFGQWSCDDPDDMHIEVDGISIAQIDAWGTGGDREMGKANAQAISAVPNLIKTGLKLYNRCEYVLGKGVLTPEFENEIKELGEALKKAGCTQ